MKLKLELIKNKLRTNNTLRNKQIMHQLVAVKNLNKVLFSEYVNSCKFGVKLANERPVGLVTLTNGWRALRRSFVNAARHMLLHFLPLSLPL